MNVIKFASSAALALAAMSAFPFAAQAQQRDRCHDYANELVSLNQRARQLRCTSWNSNHTGRGTTYNQHYAWCQRVSPAMTQNALNQWGSDFQRCQFEASGSPAAQPPRPTRTARPLSFRWVQVGGPWRSGVYPAPNGEAVCGHGAPGANCGPNERWGGHYRDGQTTQWRLGGCARPVIVIRCEIIR